MSSERRRRARVQGGWAQPARQTHSSPESQSSVKSIQSPSSSNRLPAWTARTVDVPSNPPKFVFEEPTDDIRQKPPEKTIEKPGIYDLSVSENGVSRVKLFHKFIEPEECDRLYRDLFNELPWKQKTNIRNGVSYQEPRLTAWFGDLPYRYSGVVQEANPKWSPTVQMIRERLEHNTGYQFNSVLANLYRDGHDSVDWHSDDEPGLGKQPVIASLSFGDTRVFELRQKPPPDEKGDYTYQQHYRMHLPGGSLLIMEGALQDEWQHRVPKEYHDRGARINLTYRVIYPEYQ